MSRISHLAAAFRETPLTCGPYTLRPLTAGSMMILMDTSNCLFTESEKKVSEADAMQGLMEFLWVHSAPEEQVIRLADDPANVRHAARALGLTISFEDLSDFTEQFAKIRTRIQAGMTEVIPEKGTRGKKPPQAKRSRSGSRTSSSPSAAPVIPSASTSSSGGSPSIAPSNTTTPPSCTTAPQPAGKSSIWEPKPQPVTPENVIPLD